MIELLVVIAIATIGVVYTSSTGEAESNVMADKSAKDALNEAEGQSGIGILGIDVVARKMRKVVGLREGAVSADTIAEYRAEEDDDLFDRDELAGEKAPDMVEDDWDDLDWDEEAELAAAAEEDWGDDLKVAAASHAVASKPDLAPDAAATGPEFDDEDNDLITNITQKWLVDAEEDDTPVAQADPAPAIDTADAPIVEEFDPNMDEIVIGYRPGEAGNGRIGIIEDPLRPGSAAVTLGGRCVAVVLNGFGKVRAHHIDLVCDDDDVAA